MITAYFNYLSGNKPRLAKNCRAKLNVVDIAQFLKDIPDINERLSLFKLLSASDKGAVFSYLGLDIQEEIIAALPETELCEIVRNMFFDDTVDLIQELPVNLEQKLIRSTATDDRKILNHLMNYPDEVAGSIMSPEYMAFLPDDTVKDCISKIRRQGKDMITVSTCYVVDKEDELKGLVHIKDLLLSEDDEEVQNIMRHDFVSAHTHDTIVSATSLIKKYDINTLPILNTRNKMVGIVTVDDIIDEIEESTKDSIELMAAILPTSNDAPYLKTSTLKHTGKRIVWLFLLMLAGILSGLVISFYEEAFSVVPALVAAIPMLMNTGGNSGAQSSTMVIRALASEEIKTLDFLRVWWKEIRISVVLGFGLAAFNVLRYGLIDGNWLMGITVALSLYIVVIIANSFGAILPVVAKKCKLDPAVMSAPLVTTIVDILCMLIYFSLAMVIMNPLG